jgi:hypothetical protein
MPLAVHNGGVGHRLQNRFSPHRLLEVRGTLYLRTTAYTMKDPSGYTLKVPVWMTELTAANHQISATPFLFIAAPREVYALLSLHDWSATLLSSHPHEEGQHETTQSVSGPVGPDLL